MSLKLQIRGHHRLTQLNGVFLSQFIQGYFVDKSTRHLTKIETVRVKYPIKDKRVFG